MSRGVLEGTHAGAQLCACGVSVSVHICGGGGGWVWVCTVMHVLHACVGLCLSVPVSMPVCAHPCLCTSPGCTAVCPSVELVRVSVCGCRGGGGGEGQPEPAAEVKP